MDVSNDVINIKISYKPMINKASSSIIALETLNRFKELYLLRNNGIEFEEDNTCAYDTKHIFDRYVYNNDKFNLKITRFILVNILLSNKDLFNSILDDGYNFATVTPLGNTLIISVTEERYYKMSNMENNTYNLFDKGPTYGIFK